MGPKRKPKDLEAELRQAIEQSDLTGYALAKASEVSAGQIGRFLHGERTLTLTAAARLAGALGLRLSPVATEAPKAVGTIDVDVLAAIKAGSKGRAPARLADVFKQLQAGNQALTLGSFHDSLRRLQAAGKVELSPWTGAAYQKGEACLILGSEIMAYAVAR